jgi:hypothetical protein
MEGGGERGASTGPAPSIRPFTFDVAEALAESPTEHVASAGGAHAGNSDEHASPKSPQADLPEASWDPGARLHLETAASAEPAEEHVDDEAERAGGVRGTTSATAEPEAEEATSLPAEAAEPFRFTEEGDDAETTVEGVPYAPTDGVDTHVVDTHVVARGPEPGRPTLDPALMEALAPWIAEEDEPLAPAVPSAQVAGEAPRSLHEVLAASGQEPARPASVWEAFTPAAPLNPDEAPAPRTDPFTSTLYASPFFRETPPAPAEPVPPSGEAYPPTSDAAQGWSLRRLVTGEAEPEGPSGAATDAEREKIRRLLDDLD